MKLSKVVALSMLSLFVVAQVWAAEEVKAPVADAKKCEELTHAVAAAKGDAAKTTAAEKALTDAGCKAPEKKQ